MNRNLAAETGTVIHANNGSDQPKCSPRMMRATGFGRSVNQGVKWLVVNAPVTCAHCLGTSAKPAAKKAPVQLDRFEVGMVVKTRIGQGTIKSLTKTMVTFTVEGESGTFTCKRSVLRGLNG